MLVSSVASFLSAGIVFMSPFGCGHARSYGFARVAADGAEAAFRTFWILLKQILELSNNGQLPQLLKGTGGHFDEVDSRCQLIPFKVPAVPRNGIASLFLLSINQRRY